MMIQNLDLNCRCVSSELDMIALQRELRDKSAQLHLAKSRYDQLEEKARAQREIQERTLGRLDEYNRTVRDLRRKLQVCSCVEYCTNQVLLQTGHYGIRDSY